MAVKMNFSFEQRVADAVRRRARETGKPQSQYIAELVEADFRSARDRLAAEGYRMFGAETLEFAESALPLANETWPEWEGERPGGDS